MDVSVIIAARNAADTVEETLASLRAQTHTPWEAIVVEHGSTDDTLGVAERLAIADERITVIASPETGVGAARDVGLARARAAWVLFLDAGRRLAPGALETLTRAAEQHHGADVVHGASVRVSPGGVDVAEEYVPTAGGWFADLATHCTFALHTALVRRAVIDAAGGFDPDLATCEDWDLWQRLARAGARRVGVHEPVAFSGTGAGSACGSAARLLDDGWRVIERGHGRDPRVEQPASGLADGVGPDGLAAAKLTFAAFAAGAAVAAQADLGPLLERLGALPRADVSPATVAGMVCAGVMSGADVAGGGRADLRPRITEPLGRFLSELETRSGTPELRRRAERELERRFIKGKSWGSARVGSCQTLDVTLGEPVPDVPLEAGVERLVVRVFDGENLGGVVELPACGGVAPAAVLADEIAHQHGWWVLERFFERAVYPAMRRAGAPSVDHDEIGWDLLLRETVGRRGLIGDGHVARRRAQPPRLRRARPDEPLALDVLDPPLVLVGRAERVTLLLHVAGRYAGAVRADREGRLLTGPTLVAAALGRDLLRLAVAEGLLLRAWTGTLREQLLAARAARSPSGGDGVGIRRRPGRLGLASGRHAVLPADPVLGAALADAGDVLSAIPAGDGSPLRYLPDVPADAAPAPPAPSAEPPGSASARGHFERVFAAGPDPWSYGSAYEVEKYERTLALVPSGTVGAALEIGCAEGHFTRMLAGRVGHLVAADISRIGLARAQERCSEQANVSFVRLDLERDELPGEQDLIVCSELLYYLPDRAALEAAARRMAAALRPGGSLVTAHVHLLVDDPEAPGFDWSLPFGASTFSDVFASTPGLRLRERVSTPYYRIERYVREDAQQADAAAPRIVTMAAVAPLPGVAAEFRPDGGTPKPPGSPAKPVAPFVPILMYHRVTPEPGGPLARWCVTPEAFAEQMALLADMGFHTITLDAWHDHAERSAPFPGRPCILSFDDGYADFGDHAWPVMRRYGFEANVFLPTDRVGEVNAWDARFGVTVPLMSWDDARGLEAEGVRFGSHAASHPLLTTLSVEAAARELVRSRAVLARELTHPLSAIAYPFGDVDGGIEHLAGACGYDFGLTCSPRAASIWDRPLALPRIEVARGASLAELLRDVL